jgi:hypothetical protein
MKRNLLLLIISVALLSGVRASAHHSFTATYVEKEMITIEGDLVQFLFRNPHTLIHIAVPEKNGETNRWALEWAGNAQLVRSGITRDTLKPGDHVVVTGNPGRNPSDHRLLVKKLVRPQDGWKWEGTFE